MLIKLAEHFFFSWASVEAIYFDSEKSTTYIYPRGMAKDISGEQLPTAFRIIGDVTPLIISALERGVTVLDLSTRG